MIVDLCETAPIRRPCSRAEETAATATVQYIVAGAQLLEPEDPLRGEESKTEWTAGWYRPTVSCAGDVVNVIV
ncbi:hypothetical protein [Actinoplanes xinjiangensis]|uniref:hypothetical protein n=1 Tax=Actinoplanes xinjiangensis TaxID=512350 RepID=UPI00343CD2F5